jgi:sugar phosphate isomerase/epimerase
MKERIQELAEQAGLISPQDDRENWQEYINDVEKFAELIVAECVQTLNTEIDRLCEYKNSLPEYSNHSQREDVDLVVEKCHDNIQMIKQHFGVEE